MIVTFGLGPAAGLAARQLTITRLARAGDTLPIAATHDADAGAVETVSVSLPEGQLWQAKLVDTGTGGRICAPDTLVFATSAELSPGPWSGDRLRILLAEDESSASSSSPSSASSSSRSSISTSSSSRSSQSSSSWSSQSSSASSQSASSASSISTSSSPSSHSSSSWSS